MPWQNPLSNDAGRSFAADDQSRNNPGGGTNPNLAQQDCEECPTRLVLVEFAEKPTTNTVFLGARYQYVNLSSDALVGVDPAVSSAHQLGQTPPIVVKVTPPKSKSVRLRLVREERSHNFPAGSATLSGREQGLGHLTWPAAESSVQTDAQGDGKLEPGIMISALGGFKYHVEGSIDGGAFVRSTNSVNVRRRLAIRPVVRYAAGQAAGFTAMTAIESDLDVLDIEAFRTATLTGTELGVREKPELSRELHLVGNDALDSPAAVSVFKPHAVAIIVGEFVTDPIAEQTFELDVARGADGRFPASQVVPLSRAGSGFVVVPLTNGSQLISGTVTTNSPAAVHALTAAEVQGTNRFAQQLTVNLSRFAAQPASVTTLTITLKLKAISGWAVGWAYNAHPVIYLNMRDPNTDAILSSTKAAALVIHELGHKLHLTSDGSGSLPDQPAHHYPSFNLHGRRHQGPHCSTGVAAGVDLWTDAAHNSATCTMWGALKETRLFCPECRTTLRKVDLSSGF